MSSRFAHIECYHYGKKRHIKKHCRQLKRENKNDKSKEKEKGDGNDDKVATVTDDFLILCDSYDVVNLACHETSWVIDSGASVHATSRKDYFTSYTAGDFENVKMDNDGLAKTIGIRDVCLSYYIDFEKCETYS